MKWLLILLLISLFCLPAVIFSQKQTEIDSGWKWIVPPETKQADVEKAFGESISRDKTSSFQTYVLDFGKVTIQYADDKEFIKECSCRVDSGTVITAFISPKRFKLSEMVYDLSTFKKDDTFAPRELSYYSAKEGVLIATEIVELEDKTKVERVFAIEYRPKIKAAK